jgi:antitoxin ChpS
MIQETTSDGKIVLSAKKRYSLSELLSQCDLKANPPKDLELWDNCKPIGQEVW